MSDPIALLEARSAERARILERAIERAHVDAARVGRSLTCLHKPLELHGTCAGLNAFGLPVGCLCECHDGALLAEAAAAIHADPAAG